MAGWTCSHGEILCTTLTGMAWGHNTAEMYVAGDSLSLVRKRRLGQLYLVSRPDLAWPDKPYFQQGMQRMCDQVHAEPLWQVGNRARVTALSLFRCSAHSPFIQYMPHWSWHTPLTVGRRLRDDAWRP